MSEEDMWQPMNLAPQDRTKIYVLLKDGKVEIAHWACDMSGEEQAPFKGWFVPVYNSDGGVSFNREVEPIGWRFA